MTAHRGDSTHFAENTLPAFEAALRLGVDWIELDIHHTSDNKLIVIHDDSTLRTMGIEQQVSAVTERELLDMTAIPLLAEVFELGRSHTTRISIEPKSDCLQLAANLIIDMGMKDQIGINHWNRKRLLHMRELLRGCHLFWDRPADIDIDLVKANQADVQSIVVNRKGITRALIAQIQDAGFECGSWTVNDPLEWAQFLSWGVDRFYTDHPAGLIEVKKQRCGAVS